MNIIVPLGGKGERFSKNGYTQPKPLIPIFDKCMIQYVFDNLVIHPTDNIFIIYNQSLDDHRFADFISEKYPNIIQIKIGDTKGAAETLFLGIQQIIQHHEYHKKTLVVDCDTFYTQDIRTAFQESTDNTVFYAKNYEPTPIYSYIAFSNDNTITEIREKEKISDNANTGAYAFADIITLYDYCKQVLTKDITFNGEPYTSCVISEMIKDNHVFKGYELQANSVVSLGTPAAVQTYVSNTHAFMFDLDGTLVITDDIYFDVWHKILIQYNIVLDKPIFQTYIQGNNDTYVKNTLLKTIDISVKELSERKDDLFIQNIPKLKIVNGLYDFFRDIKERGHKICIVTNCNKRVANEIVQYIEIGKYVDFVIASDDCIHGKPNPEPYQHAIAKYAILPYKCVIFEDSKSGLLSAKSVNPKILVGIETIYNAREITNYGADISIQDYVGITIDRVLSVNNTNTIVSELTTQILSNSNIQNIREVLVDTEKLKGGFIADVIAIQTVCHDGRTHSQILKYENTQENGLSIMANKLHLYDREYYFYTDIATHLTNVVKIPQFYHLVVDDDNKTRGVVLENLNDKKYKINMNLNTDSIDLSLKIVDRMARMHAHFWNKDLTHMFPQLKTSMDPVFSPFFTEFIDARYACFVEKWFRILSPRQQKICEKIHADFAEIQRRFSEGANLTFIHGDIKSPNLFYDTENENEPYFIDWQHCARGKGVQDLVFFIIESFDIDNIEDVFKMTKSYYYMKLREYGVVNYTRDQYDNDLYDALCYIPFFTSVWFGTVPQDELIDKNFPYFLISKMFYLHDFM
jgi:HAD superfamily hydrolase (TIGR01509 family)